MRLKVVMEGAAGLNCEGVETVMGVEVVMAWSGTGRGEEGEMRWNENGEWNGDGAGVAVGWS